MLRGVLGGSFAAVLVAATLTMMPSPASATGQYCDPVTLQCYTVIDQPPSDPPSNPDPETGFTPGAPVCAYTNLQSQSIPVPCTTGANYWSNSRQCYVSVAKDQASAPPGGSPEGAWYLCQQISDPTPGAPPPLRDPIGFTFWSNTPPPGINTLTPQQAAARLVKTFQIRGVDIGFAPDPNIVGSKSYVGVPIWMWVNNPQPLTYGPYSQTATLGGVTITATAKVTSILWNMGDGQTVACGSAGTPFKVEYGATASPTCGYRYTKTSKNQPGGKYTVTATSQWSVEWNGGGQNGVIPLTATSNSTVQIGELQSVNVTPGS